MEPFLNLLSPPSLLCINSQGFDEFMNVVIDDAEEVYVKTNTRKKLSKLLLKGDCITLIKRATGE